MDVKLEILQKIFKSFERLSKNEFYFFNQIANAVYSNGSHLNAEKIGHVCNLYKEYFDWNLNGEHPSLRIKWSLVQEDFPLLFLNNNISNEINEIIKSLNDEIKKEEEATQQLDTLSVASIEPLQASVNGKDYSIYKGAITDKIDTPLEDWENQQITVICDGYANQGLFLSHHENIIMFAIQSKTTRAKKAQIRLTKINFLRFIKSMIESYQQHNTHFQKLILGKIDSNDAYNSQILNLLNDYLIKTDLDPQQQKAIEKSFKKEISFIFGPPGTGKTKTLGYFIFLYHHLFPEKKILISSVANIAVDQIALAFMKAANALNVVLKQGHILRYGQAKDVKILETPLFFPLGNDIEKLRIELLNLKKKASSLAKKDDDLMIVNLEISIAHQKLQELLSKRINDARVIFTTSIRPCYDPSFINSQSFDLVVLDESSMIPFPQVLCISLAAKNQIVFSGDPKQLSPIALSNSEQSQKWLHRSILDIFEIENDKNNELITKLNTQRRMVQDICDLINDEFYQGALNTKTFPQKQMEPLPDWPFLFVDIKNGVVEKKNGSRFNECSAIYAVALSKMCLEKNEQGISVSIITPYREQVFLIRRKLKESFLEKYVSVGTVHAFQGSESDIIIFDLVDNLKDTFEHKDQQARKVEKKSIGILYHGKQGERLINVAFSRAKSKLFIVGEKNTLSHSNLSIFVSIKVTNIMQKIENNSVQPFELGVTIPTKGSQQSLDARYKELEKKAEKTQSFIELKLLESIYSQRGTPFDEICKLIQPQKEIYKGHNLITIPDFTIEKSKLKIAIFCDGKEFHSDDITKIKDAEKRNAIIRMGWKVLVFEGSKIKNNINACLQEISETYALEEFNEGND